MREHALRKLGTQKGAKAAAESHRKAADEFYSVSPAVADIIAMHEQGLGLREIARKLTEAGHLTRRGNTNWNPSQVRSILQRVENLSQGPQTKFA